MAAKAGIAACPPPVNLTFSVTEKCNSNCCTCGIGKSGITGGTDLDLSQIKKFLSRQAGVGQLGNDNAFVTQLIDKGADQCRLTGSALVADDDDNAHR